MYIALADRMHTDYRGVLTAPLAVISDYLTVMAGESKAAKNPPGDRSTFDDAPPGFMEETVTEVIQWQH